MSHVRTQIRNALAAALTGLTTTGTRVYVSRLRNIPGDSLPALRILPGAEEIEAQGISANPAMERTLTIDVEIHATSTTDVDTVVNTSLAEIEAAVGADSTLGGKAAWCVPTGVEIEVYEDSECPTARCTVSFAARYYTTQSQPQTAI